MGHRRAREDKGERSRKLRKEEVSKREPSFQVLQRSWLRNTEAHPLVFFFLTVGRAVETQKPEFRDLGKQEEDMTRDTVLRTFAVKREPLCNLLPVNIQ